MWVTNTHIHTPMALCWCLAQRLSAAATDSHMFVLHFRWRLHTDLQASVSSLLAQGAASCNLDYSGRQQSQLDTQLRSRAADGRLLVEFSSAKAARSTFADAEFLRDVVCRVTSGE